MPKSKNRKGHAQKSQQRTFMIKSKKKKAQKDFMEKIKQLQLDAHQKNLDEQKKDIVETNDIGDIGEIDKVE